jgi:hypothetical protein
MATLAIKLPSQRAQTDFNLRRWAEWIEDPQRVLNCLPTALLVVIARLLPKSEPQPPK